MESPVTINMDYELKISRLNQSEKIAMHRKIKSLIQSIDCSIIQINSSNELMVQLINTFSNQFIQNITLIKIACNRISEYIYKQILNTTNSSASLSFESTLSSHSLTEFKVWSTERNPRKNPDFRFENAKQAEDFLIKHHGLFIKGHTNIISSLVLSKDNKWIVSGSWDKTIRLWSFPEARQKAVLDNLPSAVYCVAIASDNQYIIAGFKDGTLQIWKDLLLEVILKGHTKAVECIAITSDNSCLVSGSSDSTLRIWSIGQKCQEGIFQGHTASVICLAITSDNKYAISGSEDHTIRIWNLSSKKQEAILEGHTSLVRKVAIIQENNYLISTSADSTVRIWDLKENRQDDIIVDSIDFVILNPSGNIIMLVSYESTLRLWNLREKRQESIRREYSYPMQYPVFSIDRKCIVFKSYISSTINILDINKDEEQIVLEGHTDFITAVESSDDGRIVVSGSDDKSVRVWDVEEKRQISVLLGHTNKITSIAITSDKNTVISASEDRTIRVWNVKYSRQEAIFGESPASNRIIITSDDKHILANGYGAVHVWNLKQKSLEAVMQKGFYGTKSMAITKNSRFIVSCTHRNFTEVFSFRKDSKQLFFSNVAKLVI